MAKIDIVVGGRFHADRMASALIRVGHDVRVITPFPKNRFPNLSTEILKTHISPEVYYRVLRKFGFEEFGDEKKMAWFGSLAAKSVRLDVDYVIGWSSFALESFQKTKAKKFLVRDSAHIELQMEILKKEHAKFGVKFVEKKEGIARELKEYSLCDKLLVLSEFAKKSFVEKGFPENKISKVSLGTDLSLFEPDEHVPKLPLKVVYFGTISLQKGVQYLLEAFKKIPPTVATLELIGAVSEEFGEVAHHPPMPHAELSQYLRKFDVFVFPTLQDGFGQTLLQAMASGLVPIVTENCGAAEIVEKGKSGVVIPICSPESIYESIMRLAKDENLLKQMRKEAREKSRTYSWDNYSQKIASLIP